MRYMVGALHKSKYILMRSFPPLVSSLAADGAAWAENLPDNEPRQMFVEIRLDQKRVHQATREVQWGSNIVSWNEEVILYVSRPLIANQVIEQASTGPEIAAAPFPCRYIRHPRGLVRP